MRILHTLLAGLLGIVPMVGATEPSFQKVTLTQEFWAEGAHYGDFNRDGKVDVVAGPYWYAGPDFKVRHEYRPATNTWTLKTGDGSAKTMPGYEGAMGKNNAYSDNFLTYTWDFNNDGWMDILIYPWPGKETAWFENPAGKAGLWKRHEILDVLDNESPGFDDVDGDGKPEILGCQKGFLGYGTADWSAPEKAWRFVAVTPKGAYERYTHGLGLGDINGDGRKDLLEKDGWWEQPKSLAGAPVWTKHPVKFAVAAAQMLVYDVNGDGLNDVITAVQAHGYGLVWHEQIRSEGRIDFREHIILNKDATVSDAGVQFSQVHALDLADIDGDGLKDIVTGKRFWAHGKSGPDPDSNGEAVLYWFQLTRHGGEAKFIPHLVDRDSGVGTQVTTGLITSSGRPDILVGNKKGAFLFKNQAP